MLFNSLVYAVFLPVVVFLYYGLPHRFRWMLLLPASYLFYGWWKPSFLILIAISTFVDYWAAIWIESTPGKAKRKALLAVSLTANLGLLFVFKYFDFFASSINGLWPGANVPILNLILP